MGWIAISTFAPTFWTHIISELGGVYLPLCKGRQKGHFCTAYLPHLDHVVIERTLFQEDFHGPIRVENPILS